MRLAIGGLFSVALSRGRPRWAFPSGLPYGVRTFLIRRVQRMRLPGSLSNAQYTESCGNGSPIDGQSSWANSSM